ncbi:MAG: hypothetical protein ACI854_002463 [Arenicella sp.]|jgi:hypothetical protein
MLKIIKLQKLVLSTVCVVGLLLSHQSVSVASEDVLVEKIGQCSSTINDRARLKCFDAIAISVIKKQEAVKTEVVISSQPGLPENLGGVKFDDNPVVKEGSQGLVTSCKKSADRKWFFNFENGQVWKQVNADNRRYNYKGCNFNVIISKDGFGYVMQIEEQARKIRIKRYK